MHDPLPPDLERLTALEIYLRMQHEAVLQRIAQLQAKTAGWRERPAETYLIQHIRVGVGMPGRGVLHRDDCWVSQGRVEGGYKPQAALDVLKDPQTPVTACEICRPDEDLLPPQSR